ncbi:MAG: hypothetical protein ACLUOO_03035 [Coprococcus sp.]
MNNHIVFDVISDLLKHIVTDVRLLVFRLPDTPFKLYTHEHTKRCGRLFDRPFRKAGLLLQADRKFSRWEKKPQICLIQQIAARPSFHSLVFVHHAKAESIAVCKFPFIIDVPRMT